MFATVEDLRMRQLGLVIVLLIVGLASATEIVLADNWGHWRGPTGNGASPSAKPPVEFGANKNLKWKTPIPGAGSGSPVVWGDHVFVSSAVPTEKIKNESSFQLFCINRKDGALVWTKTAVVMVPHEGMHQTNTFASASPCTDGEHVYAHFGSRGLYCYTIKGDLAWKHDFGDMRIRNGFGEGSSPTIVDNLIIVPWDHEGKSALYALDKRTGKIKWETPREEPSCWATPLVALDAEGKKQIVMNGQNAARGYDLATGEELWKCGGQTERPCASAVAADGVAYVGSGFRGAFIGAFSLAGRGDLANSKEVLWTHQQDTPDVASPLLSQGRIYYYKGKSGQLTCVDAKTGKVHYAANRIPGVNSTYASPIAAGGHVYLTDRDGTVVVIEDSATLKIVATNKVGEGVDATPAPVDNQLIVRGAKTLFCFEAK
jgi:outer membrane protein assembly factor BamB